MYKRILDKKRSFYVLLEIYVFFNINLIWGAIMGDMARDLLLNYSRDSQLE